MGFLEKVKNMFIEEIEEEEEPIKKEVIQVKIPKPVLDDEKDEEEVKDKIKITKYDDEEEEEEVEEEEKTVITVKPEKKPFVPTYFDDEDFKDLKKDEEVEDIIKPKKEEPIRHEYGQKRYEQQKIVKPQISGYNGKKEEPVKKVFQPSPVISPVYGVLDKNYKKEEITSKRKTPLTSHIYSEPNVVSVDDIRKKAFGTLEDDLEKTLIDKDAIMFTGPSNKKKVKEVKEEVKDEPKKGKKNKKEEEEVKEKEAIDIFSVLDEDSDMNELDKLLNSYDFGIEETKVEDELNKDYDKMEKELKLNEKLENSDLFNLIDEMYEKKDGE